MQPKPTPLERIEELVSDDFCHDLEWDATTNKLDKRWTIVAKKLGKIYRLSHASNGHCGNAHKEWLE